MVHHGAGLRQQLQLAGRAADDADRLVAALAREPGGADGAGLGPADRAMVAYALQLTRAPQTINIESIAALRAAGFDDRAIHDICAIVAYYAFVNRLADGLGVELEERWGSGAA